MSSQNRDDDKRSLEIVLGGGLDPEEMMLRAYEGALVLLPPNEAGLELCAFARELCEAAFHPLEPTTAQHTLSVDSFVEIAAKLKPAFIHHPRTRALQKAYLAELGFDPRRTYLDVPRMRVVSSDGYLKSGVGHKQPPHRDTWWSAPAQQIQFWSPIFPMSRYSSMEFYPYYHAQPVENTSGDFNIYRWNATGRKNAAAHRAGEDKRGIPQPVGAFKHPGACQIVLPVGGMVLFSANELHATTDNTTGKTRFSLDFRIVDEEHVRGGVGAANIDNRSTGTALRDFRRIADEAEMPAELVALYDSGQEEMEGGMLVFRPEEVAAAQ
ncbi:MAG: hypothetical protein AB7L65_01195 [Hyphomonadaceae bacterium]